MVQVQALAKSNTLSRLVDNAGNLQIWKPEPLMGESLSGVDDLFSVQTSDQYQATLLDILAHKLQTDQWMRCFRIRVHPIACTLRWSHLVARYENFWSYVNRRIEPPPALVALIASVIYSATISVSCSDPYKISRETSHGKLAQVLQSIAETALIKAKCLRSSDLETLQALVIYLVRSYLRLVCIVC